MRRKKVRRRRYPNRVNDAIEIGEKYSSPQDSFNFLPCSIIRLVNNSFRVRQTSDFRVKSSKGSSHSGMTKSNCPSTVPRVWATKGKSISLSLKWEGAHREKNCTNRKSNLFRSDSLRSCFWRWWRR